MKKQKRLLLIGALCALALVAFAAQNKHSTKFAQAAQGINMLVMTEEGVKTFIASSTPTQEDMTILRQLSEQFIFDSSNKWVIEERIIELATRTPSKVLACAVLAEIPEFDSISNRSKRKAARQSRGCN